MKKVSVHPEPPRRALVIGIDQYPYVAAAPLAGCVNDARRMADLLSQVFGFAVTLLVDGEATRQGILAALDELAREARPEERIAVHYSGHGSRIVAADGSWVETLVPHDSGRGEHPNRDVTDRELYGWLQRVWAATTCVTLVFDSCHAGGIVRDLEAPLRGVEADDRPGALAGKTAFDASDLPSIRMRDFGASGWLPPGERYTLLAACRAEERAREIEDPQTRRRHGVLTCYLAEELARVKAASALSHRDVFEPVAARVSARFGEQHPQLEGAWDRELFGARRPRTRPSPTTGPGAGAWQQALARLRADVKTDPIDPKLEIELLRRPPDGAWRPATTEGTDGLPVFSEGDLVGIRLRHLFDAPRHVAVLDLGLSGDVGLLYPARGARRELHPGLELEIGFEDDDSLELFVPPELRSAGRSERGLETLVFLLTTGPLDFGVFALEEIRGLLEAELERLEPAERSATSPLATLVRLALEGALAPDTNAPSACFEVTTRSFWVKRTDVSPSWLQTG